MIKGIYTSARGMIPQVRRQEIVANNMANVSTSGFKKDKLFTRELSKAETRKQVRPAEWQVNSTRSEVHVDFQPGVFDKTDNPLDLAIESEGFFTLQAPDGSLALTRSGAFEIDGSGFLAYPGGYLVTGEGGPIQVGSGTLSVDVSGQVEVNGTVVDRLTPQTVADVSRLERLGGSLFALPSDVELIPAAQPRVLQGYVEEANVDIVHEMVDMMIAQRTYEANARALQSQDQSLAQLLGRVAGER